MITLSENTCKKGRQDFKNAASLASLLLPSADSWYNISVSFPNIVFLEQKTEEREEKRHSDRDADNLMPWQAGSMSFWGWMKRTCCRCWCTCTSDIVTDKQCVIPTWKDAKYEKFSLSMSSTESN